MSAATYSTGISVENFDPDSNKSHHQIQPEPVKSWSSIPNSFSTSIWSPSAPVTGAWRKDPSWEKVAEKSRAGWGSVIGSHQSDIENTVNDGGTEMKEDISSSLVESMSQMNLETNRPFLPSCLDSPKNALTMWYGQRFKNFPQFKTNDCFTTWNDGGKPHELKFTSIFTCPVTGEHFASGRYGKERDVYVVIKDANTSQDVFWFHKKQHAQHAAAARALDCLSFREGKGVDTMAYGLCKEEPYLSKEDAPPLPSSTPTMLLESKTELLLKQHSLVVDMDVQCDECDRIQDREAYRQTRVQKMPDTVYAETSTSAVA